MASDFQDSLRGPLFEKFNISWIKTNFSIKNPYRSCTVPFLGCIIESIQHTVEKIPRIEMLLKDKTGTIYGTVPDRLYKEYIDYFTVGSVLVLKQCGILFAQNSYCISITPNNLLAIYHLKGNRPRADKSYKCQKSKVEEIIVQEFTIDNIWKMHKESFSYSLYKKNSLKKQSISSSSNTKNITGNCKYKLEKLAKSNTMKLELNNSSVDKKSSNNINYETNSAAQKNIVDKPFIRSHEGNKINISVTKVEKVNITMSSNQLLIKTVKEHSEIWKDLFQEVDTDALFDDF